MGQDQHDALLEKLRALKAKAEDKSVTEEEAALYAAKVGELLQKYNLSEAALNVDEIQDAVSAEERLENSRTSDTWAQRIAQQVARLYFCQTYHISFRQKVEIVFVGKKHNAEIAKSMTDYLIKTVSRLANEYARSPVAINQFGYTFAKARNGFMRGAAQRLASRIYQMWKDQNTVQPVRSKSGHPSNLPALYQDEAKVVDAFMDTLGLSTGRGGGMATGGGHAEHGRAAADRISLNTQVSGSSTRLLS